MFLIPSQKEKEGNEEVTEEATEETEGSNIEETEIIEDTMETAEEEEDQTMAIVIGNDRNLFIGIIASNFN